MHARSAAARLRQRWGRTGSRILVLTGARQTGKTTLVRHAFPDLAYVAFDDPVLRSALAALSAKDWRLRYPAAILDEVQKAPSVVETIKAAHDEDPKTRYLLLGSSQILLLDRVRESLAGRVGIEELWPLTLPEMATPSLDSAVTQSRLLSWMSHPTQTDQLVGLPLAEPSFARNRALFERYLAWGGMPALTHPDLNDEDRERWLLDYRRTYLERDVADLAALRDLDPFVRAQKALALRSGRLVNMTDLARTAGVAPATAQRFLRYLEVSYQVVALPAYSRNKDKRLAKQPKVCFLDPGILRATLGVRGATSGEIYESAVIAEIIKQVRNAALPAEFFHLRTHDGREVDLLVELRKGFVAIEVKSSARVESVDARHLRGLGALLDKRLLGALVLSEDPRARKLDDGILALPAAWALGSE